MDPETFFMVGLPGLKKLNNKHMKADLSIVEGSGQTDNIVIFIRKKRI